MGNRSSLPGIEWQDRETDLSFPDDAEIKNNWSSASSSISLNHVHRDYLI
jgi:hypothetical protein